MKKIFALALSALMVTLVGCGNAVSVSVEPNTTESEAAVESDMTNTSDTAIIDEPDTTISDESDIAIESDTAAQVATSGGQVLIPRNPGMSEKCNAENEMSYYEIELDPSLRPQYVDGGLATPYLDLGNMTVDTVRYLEDLGFMPTSYDSAKYDLELSDYTVTIWPQSYNEGDYIIVGFASKLGEPGMRYELFLTYGNYNRAAGIVTDPNLNVTIPLQIVDSVFQVIRNSLRTQAPLDYVYINSEIFVYPAEVVYVEADPYTTAIYQGSYACFWPQDDEETAPYLKCSVWYADGGPEL